ncbi:MAG: hypothetical protein ABI443_07455 [Chthoniobacterales bacterium]
MSKKDPSQENEDAMKPVPPSEELSLGEKQIKEMKEEEEGKGIPIMPSNIQLRPDIGQYDAF